jgi:hypothetical protein
MDFEELPLVALKIQEKIGFHFRKLSTATGARHDCKKER